MRLVGTLDLPILVSNATILPLRVAEIDELPLYLYTNHRSGTSLTPIHYRAQQRVC